MTNKQGNNNVDAEEPVNEKGTNAEEVCRDDGKYTDSASFGVVDFDPEEVMNTTWGEEGRVCCVHDPKEWGLIFVGFMLACTCLYFFLFGLDLLGTGAKIMGGCRAGTLFGKEKNPIAGLMVGILSTVLIQSSSTTTSIVVALVGSGIVSLDQGIFMIMGANIGTSVTNTIVAMGQMGSGDQLEHAFTGATVHDIFNFLTVAVLVPLEAASGYLHKFTAVLVRNSSTEDGEAWEGPISKIVSPLTNKFIMANKDVIKGVASGGSCSDYYPINCTDGIVSYATCEPGLISCDENTGECPAFFDINASQKDDKVTGGIVFFISIFIVFACLLGLVTVLQKMLGGVSRRVIYKATKINGYLAMVIGAGVTIFVQSSSITTSVLTPFVGAGVLRVEEMLPLTIGANLGTTLSALMAAMVADRKESLQVALAHLFFNISGIIIWYPIPFMRNIILNASKQLGKTTRLWRGFPIVYILVIFFAVPTLLLGLSSLFEQNTKGYTTLGSVLTILLVAGLVYFIYWYHFKQGKAKMTQCFRDRERRRKVNESLPDIMDKMAKVDSLEAKVAALTDHTGLPEGEGEGEEEDVEANANAAKKNTVHQENTSTSTDDGDSNEIPMS